MNSVENTPMPSADAEVVQHALEEAEPPVNPVDGYYTNANYVVGGMFIVAIVYFICSSLWKRYVAGRRQETH